MKSRIPIIAVLACAACEPLTMSGGGSNIEPGGGQKHDPERDTVSVPDPWLGYPFIDSDTTLYVSAVSRDSLGKSLFLLKNWRTALALPVGEEHFISPDEDCHHILSGHLFTEFRSSGGTVFCRDGEELLRSSEREQLLGILERDGDLYLLSSPISGEGFILRKNGRILLSGDAGRVFGDLSDPSYAPTGALYADSGHYWFTFTLDDGRCFVVKDGREEEVTVRDRVKPYQDMKVRSGTVEAASWRSGYANWEDSRLWHDGSAFVQTGEVELVAGFVRSGARRLNRSDIELLTVPGATLYFLPGLALHGVRRDSEGKLYVLKCGTAPEDALLEGEFGYFLPTQGKLLEDGLILGLNPNSGKDSPFVLYRGRRWPLSWLDADISGIQVEISPSS